MCFLLQASVLPFTGLFLEEEVFVGWGDPVAVVPGGWCDPKFLLLPGSGVDEGELGAGDADATLSADIVGTESLLENCDV